MSVNPVVLLKLPHHVPHIVVDVGPLRPLSLSDSVLEVGVVQMLDGTDEVHGPRVAWDEQPPLVVGIGRVLQGDGREVVVAQPFNEVDAITVGEANRDGKVSGCELHRVVGAVLLDTNRHVASPKAAVHLMDGDLGDEGGLAHCWFLSGWVCGWSTCSTRSRT